ncbi:LUD domain-containing protein [Halobellus clavatus]|uniref:Iron-sulfur cluster-binding protein n=1 Tax=Halobellus clavatus TaxID=660517 RepID=A0A1H3E782_9EURY|nr:LUD domain-containing protein [Halobellus clavatus]SDX74108.1 iron-sulfur cluster-binding protein [Halobellus clavatus]
MSDARTTKAEHIRHILETEGAAIEQNTQGFNDGRYESVADLEDYEGLKREAREIKEDAIERLPELLDDLREAVEANGGTLYLADDAADANEYVRQVVDDADGERVVKSKSMTTEELELNTVLETDGVDVVETDLGEWVLQLADEAPSHIVAPAIHKSRESIAALFEARFDPDQSLESAEELTRFARERLGEQLADADVGVTGANFVTADSGTMALVTSEGNARKTVAATDVHVAVAGVEKVVPTVEDLAPFLELIGRSGTGQDITSYVSLLTPPVGSPTLDFAADERGTPDDREFHLVLVDNGRLAMRQDDDLRETLYCIRCSACSNACANFQQVGGHVFGGETYSGGIATGWEAGVEGTDVAAEFNDLCTGCSRCVNACPVGIDIPWINTVVRDRINRGDVDADEGAVEWLVEGLTPDADPSGVDVQKRLFGNFGTVARLGSATAPLSNWVADTDVARALAERFVGIDRRRDLPQFQRETFREWVSARDGLALADAERTVVLFPDLYTNHVQVERGKAAVRTLEALGVAVQVPDVTASGRAPLSQGMIATARERAEAVAEALVPHVEAGYDIVVIEPSDHALFQREYEKLLDEPSHEALAANSYELLEYVYGLLANGADADELADGDGERVAYHSHCQQRTLGVERYTEAVLDERDFDVVTSDAECCGMAGSFGYKQEYYDVSVAVGEDLTAQFRTEETADRAVVASGTSCLDQLEDLLERPSRHPIELLAPE